jgi:hypothetical protein
MDSQIPWKKTDSKFNRMNYTWNRQCFKSVAEELNTKDVMTDYKWVPLFSKVTAPHLLKVVKFVLSIPVSNAAVKHTFSIMKNLCTNEQNRLKIKLNFEMTCTEFHRLVTNEKCL